jgi:hypothetical protein
MAHGFAIFTDLVGALHSLRSFRRRLPWALCTNILRIWQVIMDKFTELVEQLLMASHSSSNDCSQKVTDLLVENLPIKAATFYSYFYKTELLTLRAQCGFEYKDYASFELPLLSIAGSAVTTGTTVREGGLLESKHYRDKNIVKKYNLTDIICIPIKSSTCIETYGQNICQDISGVICLYPNNNNESHFSDELLTKLSDLVGKTYDFSVLTDRMLIRADIVQSSITSKDLNSFLHKVLHLMTKKWWLEASSVFINDERNDTLYMRATTGVNTGKRMIERIYRTSDSTRYTAKCFSSEELIAVMEPDTNNTDGLYSEQVEGKKKSEIYIPIYEPLDVDSQKDKIGVLRSCNRIVARGDYKETCCHGWEDISILLFVAEVIGVIAHLYKRVDETYLNFERAMHGINKPIKTAKVRLNSLQRYVQSKNPCTLPHPYDYFLSDSISYIDSLDWQIQKHASRDGFKTIKTERIELYGRVLSKIASLIKSQHKSYNVTNVVMTSLADKNFRQLPPVNGNEKALHMVFRNIVENAMKYHSSADDCKISFDWWSDADFLYVSVEDNGFGIDDEDIVKIFREGYRGENAMRREPTGTGIGLSDSKGIMKQLGGDILLKSKASPTAFVIKMVKWMS